MIWAFLRLDFSIAKRYRFRLVTDAIQVILTLLVFYYLSKSIGTTETFKGQYFPFLVIGLSFSRLYQTFMSAAVSSLIDMQYMGVLETILIAPRRRWTLLLSAGATDIVREIIQVVGMIVVVTFGFKVSLSLTGEINIGLMFLTLILTFLYCQGLAIISIASILMWKRVNIVTITSSIGTALISGIYFPIKILPEWLQFFSSLIPFTHTMALIRHSFGSSVEPINVTNSLAILTAYSVILILTGVLFFQYAEGKLAEKGSLTTI